MAGLEQGNPAKFDFFGFFLYGTVLYRTVREDMEHILLKDWKYGNNARTYVGRYVFYIDLKEIKVPLSFRVFESFESFMGKLTSFFN